MSNEEMVKVIIALANYGSQSKNALDLDGARQLTKLYQDVAAVINELEGRNGSDDASE